MNEKTLKTVEEKISEGRNYRFTQIFEIRTAADGNEDDGKMIVRGYATTFNEPYILRHYTSSWDGYEITIREQVDPHAFDECDMADTIMQYNHEGRVFARLSNGTMNLSVDDHGLFVEADLGGTEIGRQLYEEIKGGYTDKMSFGFTISGETREEKEDTEAKTYEVLRTITKIERLYDVSAVSIPANDATEISARSFVDGAISEIGEEFARRRARKEQIQRIRILAL